MRWLAASGILALTACASPGPEFFGAQRHVLEVEGTRIAVFVKDGAAQAIRRDYAPRGTHGEMRARLAQAIEQASGCAIRPGSAQGDSGVLTARLDCQSITVSRAPPPDGRQ